MYSQLARLFASTFGFMVGATTSLFSRMLPYLLLISTLVIIIVWYQIGLVHEIERHGGQPSGYGLHDSLEHTLNASYRWLYGYPLLALLIVADLFLISLFTRGWRARRWGRKPPEIERATRYFMG